MAKSKTTRTSSKGVKVTGTTDAEKPLVAAAKKAGQADAKRTSDATLPADAFHVVKERHTRLAEPGEGPETKMEEFETKVVLGPDQETHTRLATPNDPEARKIHEETMRMRKETGSGPVEKVQNAKDLPNEGDSPKEKRAKTEAQFAKADEAGKAEILEERRLRNAALGGGF